MTATNPNIDIETITAVDLSQATTTGQTSPLSKEKPEIVVHVIDREQQPLGSFTYDHHMSLLEAAEKNNISIGYSCRSGACFACACHVVVGADLVDVGRRDMPLVDVEKGDCLTCIAGVRDQYLQDGHPHTITLQTF